MKNIDQRTQQESVGMKNKKKNFLPMKVALFGLFVLLLFPMSSMAGTDRLVLDFGDSHLRSDNGYASTLFLKRALLEQYPGIEVSDYRLRRVVVVAKSKAGRGNVQLRVGPEVSGRYRVAGIPRDFRNGQRYTFDRIRIDNPFGDSWGPWQLHFHGNFKVRKVVLILEERPRRHYGWVPYEQFHFKMRW